MKTILITVIIFLSSLSSLVAQPRWDKGVVIPKENADLWHFTYAIPADLVMVTVSDTSLINAITWMELNITTPREIVDRTLTTGETSHHYIYSVLVHKKYMKPKKERDKLPKQQRAAVFEVDEKTKQEVIQLINSDK